MSDLYILMSENMCKAQMNIFCVVKINESLLGLERK